MSRASTIDAFFRDKVVLVTGASSGIGAALARRIGRGGGKLVLTARRKELLEQLAATIAAAGAPAPLVVACDVTVDGELERAVAASVARWGRLDVAVANAGFGVTGALRELSLDDYRRQFETNVFGVLRTMYAALPEIEKTHGRLVIIGSVAGWVSAPGASAYNMSKFALRALSDAVGPELRRIGVTLTLISPGFVVSDIRRVDNQGRLADARPDRVPSWLVMPTDRGAEHILAAVARGKREAIISGHGKALVALARFMPWVLRDMIERTSR